jgi:ribosomal protein L34E
MEVDEKGPTIRAKHAPDFGQDPGPNIVIHFVQREHTKHKVEWAVFVGHMACISQAKIGRLSQPFPGSFQHGGRGVDPMEAATQPLVELEMTPRSAPHIQDCSTSGREIHAVANEPQTAVHRLEKSIIDSCHATVGISGHWRLQTPVNALL